MFALHNFYVSCSNSFELNDINEMFNSLFKCFFEGYDKIIFSASKMENEASQKQ
jgi:hypothetical protein